MNLDSLSDAELTALYHKEKMNSLDSMTDEQLMALHKEEKERIAHSWDGPKKGARHIEGSPRHQAENEASARIARDVPIAAGQALDFVSLPVYGARKAYDAITGTERKETPYFGEDAANMFDKATDNVAAPKTASQRFMANVRQGVFGVPLLGPLGKAAQLTSTVAGTGRTANALAKTGNFLREGAKLNPANLGGAAGASALGSLASETDMPFLSPVASIAGGFLGGSLANGSARRTLAPWSLPEKQRDALRVTKDFKQAQKWARRLAIDLHKLKRDQDLGIQGTLGTYSKRSAVKTHELGQRRHPAAEKFYQDVDLQNIERYKELLGMDHPIFEQLDNAIGGDILQKGAEVHAEKIKRLEGNQIPEEELQKRLGLTNQEFQDVEPVIGGELVQKGATTRKEKKENEINKLYNKVHKNTPEEAMIPAENLRHIGSHIREDLEGLTPKEYAARVKESHSIPYIERLTENVHENPDFIPDMLEKLGISKQTVNSIRKLPIDGQKAFLKHTGIELSGKVPALTITQDIPLKSFQSTKKSLREDAKKNFGLITNAEHGGQKHLFGQMNEAENAYLKEHHPALYEAKQTADLVHAEYKQKEGHLLNEFLGPKYKPVTPEVAHSKFVSGVKKNPNYLDIPVAHLNREERGKLIYSFLKSKATKNAQGQVTAESFAKAYYKLTPTMQKKVKQYLPKNVRNSIDVNAKLAVSQKATIHIPTEEEIIIGNLLGKPGKYVTPEQAFKRATVGANTNIKNVTLAQQHLAPESQKLLNQSILKDRATKNVQGQTTATSYAKGFKQLSTKEQSAYLSHLKDPQKKIFHEAVESILSKKALEAFENTSGTTHHAQHLGIVKRGTEAITEIANAKIMPLIHFLSGDVILPNLQAKKIFTNQDFLKKINILNHAKDYKHALRIGELIMKNTSFKEALTKSVLRMKMPETND